jgi:competence protein ComEA
MWEGAVKSRIQLALGVAVCIAIVILGMLVWIDRMTPVTIAISASPQQEIQVDVRGAVASPGVVTVLSGARLQHVADAAGGFLTDADMSKLNLAGRVGDGEVVVIPSINDVAESPVTPAAGGGLVDINTATEAELLELPGIGEVLSGRIIAYREEHGPFSSVDDLQLVEGISPRMVDDLRPMITVSSGG